MENFQFCIPTNVFFGKGQISNLPDVIAGFGKKVLLSYGVESFRNSELYHTVKELLGGCEVYELFGIAPNPKIDKVREGLAIAREQHVDVILAVGGGSVIDCSKAIAAAYYYDGDPWDMIASHAEITEALPLVTVLTLSATGSEVDSGAVISNPETHEKLAIMTPALYPKASILDPENTYSVPAYQTARRLL